MKLVDNWKQSYRWFSMQAAGMKTILIGVYLSLPSKLQDAFPPKYALALAIIITIFGIMGGRLIDQNNPSNHPDDSP